MTDDEWKELGLPTDQELKDRDQRLERQEEAAIVETKKYFDRMHDKLFAFNNLLFAGYFGLIAVWKDVPNWIISIPTINSILLFYIDYRMLVWSRIEADIRIASEEARRKFGTMISKTNLYSLFSIYTTLAVVIAFVIFIWNH